MYGFKLKSFPANGNFFLRPLGDFMDDGVREDLITTVLAEAIGKVATIGLKSMDSVEISVFTLPIIGGIEPGFVFTRGKTAWVISPAWLPWLVNDSELMTETAGVTPVVTPVTKKSSPKDKSDMGDGAKLFGWKTSTKGNQTAKHRGCNCTVFRSRQGPGYAGIISRGEDEKVFTETLPSEEEVMQDIEGSFDEYLAKMA